MAVAREAGRGLEGVHSVGVQEALLLSKLRLGTWVHFLVPDLRVRMDMSLSPFVAAITFAKNFSPNADCHSVLILLMRASVYCYARSEWI